MKITINNFKCWEKETFDFKNKGITLLSGKSGVGKTSIVEAIIFVLFGTGRKITKYGKKQCIVEMEDIWQDDKITIKRQKNPNRLILIKNSSQYEDDAAQEIINTKYSDVYQHVGYLNQSSINSFLLMGPQEKLSFLERLVFENMDMNKIKKKLNILIKERLQEIQITTGKKDMLQQILNDSNETQEPTFPIECKDQTICEKNQTIRKQNQTKLLAQYNKKLTQLNQLEDHTRQYNDINKELSLKYTLNEQEVLELETKLSGYQSGVEIKQQVDDLENQLKLLKSKKQAIENKKLYEQKKDQYDSGLKNLKQDLEQKQKENNEIIDIMSDDFQESIDDMKEYVDDAVEFNKLAIDIAQYRDELTANDMEQSKEKYERYRKDVEKYKKKIESYKFIKKVYSCPQCTTKLTICPKTTELITISSNHSEDNIDEITSKLRKKEKEIVKLEQLMTKMLHVQSTIEDYIKKQDDIATKYEEFDTSSQTIEEYRNIIDRDTKTLHDIEKAIDNQKEITAKLVSHNYGDIYLNRLEQELHHLNVDEHYHTDAIDTVDAIDAIDVKEKALHEELAEIKMRDKIVNEIKSTIEQKRTYLSQLKTSLEDNVRRYDTNIEEIGIKKMSAGNIKKNREIFEEKKNTSIDIIQTCEQNLLDISKWKVEHDAYQKHQKQKKELANLIEHEKIYSERVRASYRLKDIIAGAEKMAIINMINTINDYAARYLELFFTENPITVRLELIKTEKTEKETIGIIIYYKDMEADISILSGGELQRTVIAFNLALAEIYAVPLVLLDECTSNLDQELTETVIKGIKYTNLNKSVILIAHQVVSGIFDNIISI